ncbi:MAG: hypothetical protein N3D71_02555 [Burkholderiaceae bacterium]|nr:hypothetical protein [Burkholderiaceae bacterium]
MIDAKDLLKPGAVVFGVAAAAALGFAAGFVVARDPAALRRLARAVAGGVERVSVALAESREEFADLWAEVREQAREEIQERAFAAAAAVPSPEAQPPAAETADQSAAVRRRTTSRRTAARDAETVRDGRTPAQ